MINKYLCFVQLLLISMPNYTFFGPVVSLMFNGQMHNITIDPDYFYTYRNLRDEITTELSLPKNQIAAMNRATRIYLNLDSYEEVKDLCIDKPLKLLITLDATPVVKSFFDYDDLL